MTSCRVCGTALAAPVYSVPGPSITSLATMLDVPATVYTCAVCDHAQGPTLQDVEKFYDTGYQISAASSDHDQLYAVVDGEPVYRTARQAGAVLEILTLPQGARVLDFGAAKAATLQKLMESRPDIQGCVFDVSESYLKYWKTWLRPDQYATHAIPAGWASSFDAVTAHYVLEHVVAPVELVTAIAALLKPGGWLFLSVPDPVANPGDLLVVDHLNHFTPMSLATTMSAAGLRVDRIDRLVLSAALVVVAVKDDALAVNIAAPPSERAEIERLCSYWQQAAQRVRATAMAAGDVPSAIYGAGFYGTWIASLLGAGSNIVCFIDSNPHIRSAPHLGRPVVAPDVVPVDVKFVFAGVNPLRAREIMASNGLAADNTKTIVYLD